MDKSQLELLLKSAEKARKVKDENGFGFDKIQDYQPYDIKVSDMFRQQIINSLLKLDLSNFVNSLPKINYTKFLTNYYLPFPKIDESLLSEIFTKQIFSLQKIAMDFSKVHASDLAKIRANAFLMSSSIENIQNMPELRDSFAAGVASTINRIFENSENNETSLNEFEEFVETEVSNQPSSLSRIEVLMLILALLQTLFGGGQFYYSKLQYDESKASSVIEDARYFEMMKTLNRIANSLSKDFENDKNFYVVERTVELKVKPKFKSYTIAVLYPNQQVQLVKNSHKWIYVEYFDYIDGTPKYGWVNKKYLVKIKNNSF